MRMSCNGCRVLRKRCSEGCTIRPCLEWIKSPEAQANATIFLAKFYGRAGLLNLLAAGPDNLRPALFRSLLYEACGRMVNPIYGSVGLLWSGQWEACQAAVEAVLKGDRIVQVSSESAIAAQAAPLLRAYDIRHAAKDADAAAADKLGVAHTGRTRFKRASSSTSKSKGPGAKHTPPTTPRQEPEPEPVVVGEYDDHDRAPSHEESAGSHDHNHGHVEDDGRTVEGTREESQDTEVEAGSYVSQAEQSSVVMTTRQVLAEEEIRLELTLGLEPVTRVMRTPPARFDISSFSAESSHIGLRLELPA